MVLFAERDKIATFHSQFVAPPKLYSNQSLSLTDYAHAIYDKLCGMKRKVIKGSVRATSEFRAIDLSSEGCPFIPVFVHRHNTKPDEGSPLHRHPGFIEVIFCLKGDRTFCRHGKKKIDFRPGDVFVAQPNALHCLKTYPNGLEIHCFQLKLTTPERQFPHLAPAESRELLHRLSKLPTRFTGGDTIRRAFTEIWKIYDSPETTPLRTLTLRLAVYHLLTSLISAAAEPEEPHSTTSLDALLAEMQKHPERHYPIKELARRLGTNAVYLNRLFKRAVGLPPHAWLSSLRIEHAKKLLKDGHSVTEVARQTGFPSAQHFATRFRKETGQTPSTYGLT